MAWHLWREESKNKIIMGAYIEKIKKILKREKRVEEKKPSRNPYRDWAIIFVSSVTVCLLLMGGAVYVFFGIRTGALPGADDVKRAVTGKKFNEKNLTHMVELFKKRAEEYEAFKTEKVQIADPSL